MVSITNGLIKTARWDLVRPTAVVRPALSERALRPACPVCGGRLIEIRSKVCCTVCRSFIETCCDD